MTRSSQSPLRFCIIILWTAGLSASCAFAAPPLTEKQRREKYAEIDRRFAERRAAGEHDSADALFRAQLEICPTDPIAGYNLACALAFQGSPDATKALADAINNGYDDIRRMKRDPMIADVIKTPEIQSLFSNWNKVLESNLEHIITNSRKYVPKVAPLRDDALRIAYLSPFDSASIMLSRNELSAIAAWADKNVFIDLNKPSELAFDPWVLLVLPSRQNFNIWVADNFGAPAPGSIAVVGGQYEDYFKRLVAQDLGSTLRHEFMHVLQWRDMTHRGVTYPKWLQEGMCCLAEDYDLQGDLSTGTITPAHSWRTNAVIRLARNNKAMTIRQLSTMTDEQFAASRPLATYAQARTFFMYLYSKNKLKNWYQAYAQNFKDDQSAFTALRLTLNMSEAEAEKDYKSYLKSLKEIPEDVPMGSASMGVEVAAGQGEGPVITSTYGHRSFRSGDVLLTMNHRPVRDIAELVRLLSLRQPGEETAFTLRRGKQTIEITIPLAQKGNS